MSALLNNGGGGGGGISNIANRSMGSFPSDVSHWPPSYSDQPPGFGRSTTFAMPNTGTYFSSLSSMMNSSVGSTGVHSTGPTNIDMGVPSTDVFIATNETDESLKLLAEGDLMFSLVRHTFWHRGMAYNLPAANSLLLQTLNNTSFGTRANGAVVAALRQMSAAVANSTVASGGKRKAEDFDISGGSDDDDGSSSKQRFDPLKQAPYAISVEDACQKWLPLGPLLGTMTDSESNHTAFTYASCGQAVMPQLAVDFKVGDYFGIVYTEMSMADHGSTVYDVSGTAISDLAMPTDAIQIRFINLSSCGLDTQSESSSLPLEVCGYIGDPLHVNPYHPLYGIKDSQLQAPRVIENATTRKTVRIPRKAIPHTVCLGRVLQVPTVRPTQAEVNEAHISPLGYKKLFEKSRMLVAMIRPTKATVHHATRWGAYEKGLNNGEFDLW